MTAKNEAEQVAKQRTFLGHPIGLYVLFFTEMWERFSYYGMRALLVLYMVDFFKWTQEDASKIYKWYTALVYLTPLLGGFLADRYLGNRMAIIIGAILMAVGHFLMAFEELWIFYAALGFLIMGNGFFKPNMSVQVGRLYPQNDPRRDGAYTIFYMGINIGAFLAPLVCGALRDTKAFGYHWGFGAAGIGMVLGLITYLVGLPFIKELQEGAVFEGADAKPDQNEDADAMSEAEAAKTPSVLGWLSEASAKIVYGIGVFFIAGSIAGYFLGAVSFDNLVASIIAGGSMFFAGWIVANLDMAVRDRVLAIYALFVFVVFFWAAFEQAGNAMNVWADQTTNRYLTTEAPEPDLYPEAPVDLQEEGLLATMGSAFAKIFQLNPVLTTSFQSINAFGIVVFAPIFAWLWLYLAEKRINVSIAMKMSLGVFLQGLAFALMIWAALYENQSSEVSLKALPASMVEKDGVVHFYDAPDLGQTEAVANFGQFGDSAEETMIAQGGRMRFADGKLLISGVLDSNHRDRILRGTVDPGFLPQIHDFVQKTQEAKKSDSAAGGTTGFTVEQKIEDLPAGFEPRYLTGFGEKNLRFDPATNSLISTVELADKDFKQILLTGSDPETRAALNQLYIDSAKFKVGSSWLFWFYILCTLGELCLSPVGLSMVSKLAPRRFATMLMGMWLLTSFFGNFLAGLAGENWELLEPKNYFLYVTLAMLGASAICFVLVQVITKMMHGVR